jgi:predicted nucleic acid-binding protein
MKYVIDATIGFMWEVAEPFSGKAQLLRADFQNGIHDLLGPDLFPNETANALMVAERRGRILPGQATLFFTDLLTTLPAIHPSLPDLCTRALEIASNSIASVYDCIHVALAERDGCDLVTADDKLVKKLQRQFPFIKHISSFP